MEIIPAIDLKSGKCVRLYQGDYTRETIFSEDPLAVALKWQSLGAKRLHLIDLDGAASGKPENIKVIKKIVNRIDIPVQLGGGIRDAITVNKMLKIGINRVIMGTTAFKQPELMEQLSRKYGEAIIVSIDARDGLVAIGGWLESTSTNEIDLAQQMKSLGVKRILYTDIKRDGTLTEPAYASIRKLIDTTKLLLIAAGGISRLEHLIKLADIGAEGAVIGRALYTGDIDLKKALAL
jgi:phosphoribosylformimino-5-aminoimidazole carboxamide ribotide isomerase